MIVIIDISEYKMPPKLGKTRHLKVDKRAEYLGISKMMLEDDLPTLRACLRYGMHLREQSMLKDEELGVTEMAIGSTGKLLLCISRPMPSFLPL